MGNTNGYQETIEWYERNAEKYARKSKEFARTDLKQLNEFASLLPTKSKVLDAGCGSGRDTNLFFAKGFNVIGVDLSKQLIISAKINYPDCNFEEGDILNLRFPDKSFDGVWAHASLVHFDSIDQFDKSIDELRRVLKDNGLIHILMRAMNSNRISDSISNGERFYLNLTSDQLKSILEQRKFEILSIEQYNENDIEPGKRPGEGIEWILFIAKKFPQN